MPSPEHRFWSKVSKTEVCWIWLASTSTNGYGQFWPITNGEGRRKVAAHRYAWEITNGPVPAGMFVCHRCDNPLCVNPSHLFVGSPSDNTRDMLAKGRHRPRFTAGICSKGHAFDEGFCRECRRLRDRERKRRLAREDPTYRPLLAERARRHRAKVRGELQETSQNVAPSADAESAPISSEGHTHA